MLVSIGRREDNEKKKILVFFSSLFTLIFIGFHSISILVLFSDVTSENPKLAASKSFGSSFNRAMPVTKSIDRSPMSLPNTPPKHYTLPSNLTTQYEDNDGSESAISVRISRKSYGDSTKRSNVSIKPSIQSQTSRRQGNNDLPISRGRSNTDVQSVFVPAHILKQQSTLSNAGSEKNLNQTPPIPTKPRCTLPSSNAQAGLVTPTKLFNMMGYGCENQYFFMDAHYLYIIDCRSREEYNDNHIVTGKNY